MCIEGGVLIFFLFLIFIPFYIFPMPKMFGSKVQSCSPTIIYSIYFGSCITKKNFQCVGMPLSSSMMYRFPDDGIYVWLYTRLQ